jgi:hypothetical protein
MKSLFYTINVVILTLTSLTGCSLGGLMVGQVNPVDEKSQGVQAVALEKIDPNWKRVDMDESDTSSGSPDRAWQSVKTASVISLNSACRGHNNHDLAEITSDLLIQWRDLRNISQKEITLSGYKALETTAEGIYFNRKRKLQTIVVKTPTCIYDLIFLGSIRNFPQDLAVFQAFRDKLILK